MSIFTVMVLAFSVSIDAFAVSVSGAMCDRTGRQLRNACNAALFFGGFQFVMPLVGYFIAGLFAELVNAVDHWIACILLGFVGGKMIIEGIRSGKAGKEAGGPDEATSCAAEASDFFAPRALFVPAVATSLDALAVGAGLAFAESLIWGPALAMGVFTAAASAVGVLLGRRLGVLAGERIMLILGGSAIVLIGLKILFDHTR